MTVQRNIRDERYDGEAYVFGTDPNDFLAAHRSVIPAGPVLCIGDGEGRNGVFLAQHGHRVVSVDASSVGLAKAQQLAAGRGVEIETLTADLAHFISTEVNIWDDPSAAAFVRSVANGNETVPTVTVGTAAFVNPTPRDVIAAAGLTPLDRPSRFARLLRRR